MLSLPYLQLDDHTFEELCYELLGCMNFKNLRWRSPGADGGRDIEGETFAADPSGALNRETWYVECKRYSNGVPLDEISPKYGAALMDGRDYLLVIASSYLTNSCLDHLDRRAAEHPRPRIRYWNGHDLTRRVLDHPHLLDKYFPNLVGGTAPRWVDTNSAAQRNIAAAALARHAILPTVQDALARMLAISGEGDAAAILLARAAAYLNATTLLLDSQPPEVSRRMFQVNNVLVEELRGMDIALQGEPTSVLANVALTRVILRELLDNARRYGEAGSMSVHVENSGGRAAIRVMNRSAISDSVPRDFAELGQRSAAAVARHPSGAGFGCWLAQLLATVQKTPLSWPTKGALWEAQLEVPMVLE